MRLIDAEALENELVKTMRYVPKNAVLDVACMVNRAPTIEAKPVVHAHWISASWEEDEEDGIENTYSDEFICSNCKEHLYFPDAIEKEDIGFSFCPYCGVQMDESISCSHEDDKPISQAHENGVKIPVISMEDVPKIIKEMEK